jgi:hypothetical protein
MKSKILLEDIKIYAYHGVLPEEKILGTYYIVNAEIVADISKAAADRGILEIVAMIKRVSFTDPAEIIHHLVDKFHPETGYAKLNSVHQKIFAKENEEFGTAIKELTIEKVIAILKS